MTQFAKNLKKLQFSIFFYIIVLKLFCFAEEEKNIIILVLPFEEISLEPELSSPPVSESRGGSVRVTHTHGWKSLCLILDVTFLLKINENWLIIQGVKKKFDCPASSAF